MCKIIHKKKKCKKGKQLSEVNLQIAVKRRKVKNKGEKERDKHLNAELQRIARRDTRAFLRDQIANICQIIEKAREFQKNIYFCFIDYAKAFDCVEKLNCEIKLNLNCGKF